MEIKDFFTLNDLFAQLGLDNDDKSIEKFIEQHRPLPQSINIADAAWWTESQKEFLRQGIEDDENWSYPIDELSELLR